MSDQPCPFCGSTDIELRQRRSAYDHDAIYCNNCKTEFTYFPTHIATVWNKRTETDESHCPFCGGEVEFDGNMNHQYLFADAYCPTCGWRFEFQRTKAVAARFQTETGIQQAREKTITRAKKAFSRRPA